MLEFIQNIDTLLFRAVNSGLSNPVFDIIMPFITTNSHWYLVYFFFLGMLIWKGGKTGRICAFTLVIAITVSDQLNSEILKDLFDRLRPCHVLKDINLLVPCGEGRSFSSTHAVNSFNAALILSYFYRRYAWLLFSLAFLIAFSRVYTGVHYPLDIIGGAATGIIIAWLFILILKRIPWIERK